MEVGGNGRGSAQTFGAEFSAPFSWGGSLECSAGGAVELGIEDGRSLHTNHPLGSRNVIFPGADLAGSANSRARLASLAMDLSPASTGIVGPEAVKTALSACRTDGAVSISVEEGAPLTESMTIGAVVYEFGETVSLSVCAGPPRDEDWMRLTLRED